MAENTTIRSGQTTIIKETVIQKEDTKFATTEEAKAGLNEDKSINPKLLKDVLSDYNSVEYATQGETTQGLVENKAVTPKTLKGVMGQIPTVTYATVEEVEAGTVTNKVISPKTLKDAGGVGGGVEFANQEETTEGVLIAKAISPKRLKDYVDERLENFDSVSYATEEEALTGVEVAKSISPSTLKHVLDNAELSGAGRTPTRVDIDVSMQLPQHYDLAIVRQAGVVLNLCELTQVPSELVNGVAVKVLNNSNSDIYVRGSGTVADSSRFRFIPDTVVAGLDTTSTAIVVGSVTVVGSPTLNYSSNNDYALKKLMGIGG